LMAEKMTDFVCRQLQVTANCRTGFEALIEDPPKQLLTQARRYFPAYGAELAAARLGPKFTAVVDSIKENSDRSQLVCECELVTLAEIETIAADPTTTSLNDIRRRTRMGMGTCQGTFCGLRSIGAVVSNNLLPEKDATEHLKEYLEARWSGIRPILWGNQLREAELTMGIYAATLNIDGAKYHEQE